MSQAAKDRILAALVPDEIVDLAKALVHTTDETPVARFLDQLFRREGLESLLQEVDPGRFQVLARLPGAGGGCSAASRGRRRAQPHAQTGTSTSTRSREAGCATPGRPPSRATDSTGPGSSDCRGPGV
jgi:hypothetical protein